MKAKSFFKRNHLIAIGILLAAVLIIFSVDMVNGVGTFYGIDNLSSAEVSLKMEKEPLLILDVRDREEYEVSHLKGAQLAGDVDLESLQTDQPILVYCTVGLRSTELGATLTKKGFSHIYNLNGGLIRWKNNGYEVYNIHEQPTDSVHVYSGLFGLLLTDGHAVK